MPTIKDVARLAGVGVGTASRVVSGRGSVAPATAVKVRKAIEELDFRPNHAARSLLSGSSQTIGVYIPVLKGTFYTPILQTIDAELRAAGKHMVVAFGSGDGNAREQAVEGTEYLTATGCDGLAVMSTELLEEDIAALGPIHRNVLVLNHRFDSIASQCFTADHVQGGTVAAMALVEKGHRRIAVVRGPAGAPDNLDRIDGFMSELRRQGVDPKGVVALDGDFSPEGGWSAAETLVKGKHDITAVFCANDEMAVGVLCYLQQAGVAVPRKLSVLGYDDTQSAEFSAPRLTSVHIPWRDITRNGVRWLLNQCYESGFPVERHFPVSVTWRSSLLSAPIRPA